MLFFSRLVIQIYYVVFEGKHEMFLRHLLKFYDPKCQVKSIYIQTNNDNLNHKIEQVILSYNGYRFDDDWRQNRLKNIYTKVLKNIYNIGKTSEIYQLT